VNGRGSARIGWRFGLGTTNRTNFHERDVDARVLGNHRGHGGHREKRSFLFGLFLATDGHGFARIEWRVLCVVYFFVVSQERTRITQIF
jgi:hypothetical protein